MDFATANMDDDSESSLSSLESSLSSLEPSLSFTESISSRDSSPLSSPASSPEPPPGLLLRMRTMARVQIPYPSPPSSQKTSQRGSPVSDGMESGSNTDKDGPPPAKRRRLATKEDRTTEHLDLRFSKVKVAQQPQLDRLLHVLEKRQKIIVVAGAGISVSAGIPDFRSSTGLFKSLKEEHNLKGSGKHLFDASVYSHDNATSTFHSMVRSMSELTKNAKPTAFHHMLATLAKEDRLLRLYTQNVDGIDTSLHPLATRVPLQKNEDGKWPQTVQLHGGLDKMVCSKCHAISDFDAELFAGSVPPLCSACEEVDDIRTNIEGKRSHGIGRLRPRMVLYNEHNPDDEAIGAVTREDLRKRPDAVIVVGTTLKVPGVRRIVREMCKSVKDRRGGVAIWINNDPEPVGKEFEDCWDIVVRGGCDKVAKLANMRQWNELDYKEVSDEEAEVAKTKQGNVQVHQSAGIKPAHVDTNPLLGGRLNESFPPPPPMTPSHRLHSERSPSYSPLTSTRSSIQQSIENQSSDVDNIQVATPLKTPTKSQKPSPTKRDITAALKAVQKKSQPKAAAKTMKATTTKVKRATDSKRPKTAIKAPKKNSNVKFVKPHPKSTKSTVQSIAEQARKPKMTTITASFKSTKAGATAAGRDAKGKASPLSTKTADSALTEPMAPVSPQDSRNNTSPSKSKVSFPGLASENAMTTVKLKSNSIASVLN